jgi:protein TonB
MAPLPPLTPSPPGPPGTRTPVRTRTTLSDEIIARPEAAEIILAKLRAMVASGTQEADAILGTIAVAAHALTGASGAAIAMPRDGEVVCVGRSGDIAPNLGARLDVDCGISGECLRTGMNLRCDDAARDFKVDPEVCRQLGLQSIAVVPLRGQAGRVGVLEVFSTQSYAFTEEHVNLLGRLAGLAETAWARGTAAEPLPAEPAFAESALAGSPEEEIAEEPVAAASHTPDPVSEAPAVSAKGPITARPITAGPIDEELRLSRASIALERVGDAIASGLRREQENERKWHLGVVAGLSVLVLLLVSVIGWKTWHKAGAQPAADRTDVSQPVNAADTAKQQAGPGKVSKPALNRPLASSTNKETHASKSSASVKIPDKVTRRQPASPQVSDQDNADAGAASVSPESTDSAPNAADVSQIAASSAGPSALGNVLSASPALPKLGVPVSEGVAGGTLVHKVQPVYPVEARRLHLEGTVILDATITQEGQIENLKLVSGDPVLAKAATEAVSKWRYTPYLLNGRPIVKQTRINIKFIAP